ncbi:non-ribosomal peptide synthetase [Enterovibrio norvegicus FF-33]|uniref:non-ribosomal peptide synthetase n=1 Tax=Enterovibrio norvegicus TaxID=188144 RepID=UPI0002DB042C|nr:non-ribosomal peptide synthetase [Enterovibrio norvegicus]OEE65939.1 non-ribosomal peptide synthetase [Enterovibrio norvegicus FF-33]
MDLNIIDQIGFSNESSDHIEEVNSNDIAVIGIEVNLPACSNKYDFWSMLKSEEHGVSTFPSDRQVDTDAYMRFKHPNLSPAYRTGGYLDSVDKFDPAFFGMSPKEAALTDPHQKLFLQTAYHAIEDAGYTGKIQDSETGIYLGYAHDALYRQYIDDVAPEHKASSTLGNLASMTASRLAYLLNLQGPSMVVDTACSSSLTALHLACQGLRNGDCETAIVGAVNLMLLPIETGDKIGIESVDGFTRTFSDDSSGTGLGEGVIALLLKPLTHAIDDKDNIWGVIKGSAINQDGRSAGISAPNGDAQQKVLAKAWRNAGIDPRNLSYMEAHGTGTKLGDPIEVSAINAAFRQFTSDTGFCPIGSAKTNLGHLDSAAGLLGIVKTLLCLKNNLIVPSLFFNAPNPAISFDGAVSVATSKQKWEGENRLAGVSAFGLSGTNCHVVLESAPILDASIDDQLAQYPFFLSAKTPYALTLLIHKTIEWLKQSPRCFSQDLSYTSIAGRAHFDFRIAVNFTDATSLITELEKAINDNNAIDINNVDDVDSRSQETNITTNFLAGKTSFNASEIPFSGHRISMPGYAFEPQRCWTPVPESSADTIETPPTLEPEVSSIVLPEVELEGQYVSDTAQIVANIWGYTLDIDTLSPDDDYYLLGGDSIFALDVQQLVNSELNVSIELHELLEHSVLSAFTQLVESRLHTEITNSHLPASHDNEISPLKSPLSFAQKRLWFLEQLEDLGSALNLPTALEIKGNLNVESLTKAIDLIAQRHSALRARFSTDDNEVTQSFDASLSCFEQRYIAENDLSSTLEGLANQRFLLTEGKLFKVSLVTLSETRHILLINCHHIIADGWSISLIIRELSEGYARIESGTTPSVQPPRAFSDYAFSQQEVVANSEEDAFWCNYLSNLPTTPWLPTDFPRPEKQSHAGASFELALSDTLSTQVKQWSREQGLTLYMSLKAAFDITLALYSGHYDIVVGTPVSGRESNKGEDWRQTVGLFINNLVLRSQVLPEKTVSTLVAEVKQDCLRSFAHQAMPFERLVELLQPDRDLSSSPLFQVMFALQNAPVDTVELNALTLRILPPLKQASQYDLTLNLFDANDGIAGAFEYCSDLYTKESVESLSTLYRDVLVAMVNNADRKISDLLENQTNDVTKQPENTSDWLSAISSIREMLPEAVAFEYNDKAVTYREFTDNAQQLAHTLTDHNCDLSMVAVAARTPEELATATLASFMAGGSVLVLDGENSHAYLTTMMEQSGATVAIVPTPLETLDTIPQFTYGDRRILSKNTPVSSHDRCGDIYLWDGEAKTLQCVCRQKIASWLNHLKQELPLQSEERWATSAHDSIAQLIVDAFYPTSQGGKVTRLDVASTLPKRNIEASLKSALTLDLPAHMIPSSIISLASFPTTPNGKIDRKALPAQNAFKTESVQEHDVSEDIAVWVDMLRDAPMLHSIPLDGTRTADSFNRQSQLSCMPPSTHEGLRLLSQSNNIENHWLALSLLTAAISYRGYEASLVINICHNDERKPVVIPFDTNQTILSLAFDLKRLWESLPSWSAVKYNDEMMLSTAIFNPVYQIEFGSTVSEEPTDIALQYDDNDNLYWHYNSTVLTSTTIGLLDAAFEQLASEFIAHPAQSPSEYCLVDQKSVEYLQNWNPQIEPEASNGQLISLFENAVNQFTSKTASKFIANDGDIKDRSFADLDQQSDTLAKHLVESGVNKGDLIALYLPHSDSLLIALLGILKSGAAYVPLDPSHPAARNTGILNDTECKWIVTDSVLRTQLPNTLAHPVCIDALPAMKHDTLLPSILPNDTAYVIFTSGSTGKPKGVIISHGAAFNFINGMHDSLPTALRTHWLWLTTVSFDIALYEWLGCLSLGQCCVIPCSEIIADARRINTLVSDQHIDLIQTTPSRWKLLLDNELPKSGSLLALCGGEALPEQTKDRLVTHFDEVWNCYGPTEATVWSLLAKCSLNEPVSLGQNLPGYQHFILSQEGQILPYGAVGELCIGGVSLAEGYLNRPDLTSKQFVNSEAGYVYRTGDLATLNHDESMVYIGRIDDQIKLRGHRIELGEIANNLKAQDEVSDAIVIARDDRLIAYVVSNTAELPDPLDPIALDSTSWVHLSKKQVNASDSIRCNKDTATYSLLVSGDLIESSSLQKLDSSQHVTMLHNVTLGAFDGFIHANTRHDLGWKFLPLGSPLSSDITTKNATKGQGVSVTSVGFGGKEKPQILVRGDTLRPVLSQPYITHYQTQHSALLEKSLLGIENVTASLVARNEDNTLIAFFAASSEHINTASVQKILERKYPRQDLPTAIYMLSEETIHRYYHSPSTLLERAEAQRQLTDTELALKTIWQDVLNIEELGLSDNFFTVGGHSLLAAKIITRVEETFNLRLPLKTVFTHSTLALFSSEIEQSTRNVADVDKPVTPVSRNQLLPLSLTQQRLWLIEQIGEQSAGYNVYDGYVLEGNLDNGALNDAFTTIVSRHEVFRSRFPTVDGEPMLVIQDQFDLELRIEDCDESQLDGLLKRDALAPFDLEHGPLFRVRIFKLSRDKHVLWINMHHIITDLWSVGLLMDEVISLYTSKLAGHTLDPTPPRLQYADYAVWQRDHVRSNTFNMEVTYWQKQLKDLPPLLELPTDYPRPVVQRFEGEKITVQLSSSLTSRIKALSEDQGTTLFNVLLSAYQILLTRYANTDDIAVASPNAGRTRYEVEEMLGFFINTLVLRSSVDSKQPFVEFLHQVSNMAAEAQTNQNVPFEHLVEVLQPVRNTSHQPLAQVSIALQNAVSSNLALDRLQLPDLSLQPIDVDASVTKFDLTLWASEQQDKLTTVWEFNTSLFDRQTVEEMASHFTVLLESIVSRPVEQIGRLEWLTSNEWKRLVHEWNQTSDEYDQQQTLHRYFESQVAQQPNAIALVDCDGDEMTYRELDARANQLANQLRNQGAKTGSLIPVCLERDTNTVVAVMGIVKAGAAYVPIEINSPRSRVRNILTQIGQANDVNIIVTCQSQLCAFRQAKWLDTQIDSFIVMDALNEHVQTELGRFSDTRAMFDHIAENANDEITAGGFTSIYNGKCFAQDQVDRYRDHVVNLCEPFMHKDATVLEIGCGSGIISFELASQVKHYYAIDPSEKALAANRLKQASNLPGLSFHQGFAHESVPVELGSVDVILLASTAQFFPGYRYTESVIDALTPLLKPNGKLVFCDLPDLAKKGELESSIASFSDNNPDSINSAWRQDLEKPLYFHSEFFEEVSRSTAIYKNPTIISRSALFDDELQYRFDVVLDRCSPLAPTDPLITTQWHQKQQSADNENRHIPSDSTAYIIFTSGTTGTPKGVEMQHRAVYNTLNWVNTSQNVDKHDRLLFVTSLSFDLSVYDIFGVLGAGGSIRIASNDECKDPEKLANILLREPITFWDSSPAYMKQLMPLMEGLISKSGADNSRLKRVFFSGDWIGLALPKHVERYFPNAAILGLGGATEAAIWSNFYPISDINPAWVSIPYGRPIANAQYYVLDELLSPCPVGVPGDLYIGGDCLAKGYYDDQVMTDRKFIANPLSDTPSARLYHTGDRARWMRSESGVLEFLGREDFQVKLRGFRIELGEIESKLLSHEKIEEAFVHLRRDPDGKEALDCLVAYLITSADDHVSTDSLRRFLSTHLPEYMVPTFYVELSAFPVTSNGKLDRSALPDPQTESNALSSIVLPETDEETALLVLWQSELSRQSISTNDDFFHIGGNSISAVRLIGAIQKTFGLTVPLRVVFEHRTIQAMSAVLAEIKASNQSPRVSPSAMQIPSEPDRKFAPLTAAQAGIFFIDRFEENSSAYHIPSLVELTSSADIAALKQALDAVVQKHSILRTHFSLNSEHVPVQEIMEKREEITTYTEHDNVELESLIRSLATKKFDLSQTGPVRFALFNNGETNLLLMTFHHIAFDGWSADIFLKDLAVAYSQVTAGKAIDLKPAANSFADYAAWNEKELSNGRMDVLKQYWIPQLSGYQNLAIRNDYSRPSVFNYDGIASSFSLNTNESRALRALAESHDVTLYTVMMAALYVTLSKLSGQNDVVIGTPSDNRNNADTQEIIGLFVNSLPIRLSCNETQSVSSLFNTTNKSLLDAKEHQDMSFETLTQLLDVPRDTSRHPIFQVMFSVQSFATNKDHAEELPFRVPSGTSASLFPKTAKFDLNMFIDDSAEEISGELTGAASLYSTQTLERINELYTHVLEQFSSIADLHLQDIDGLTAQDKLWLSNHSKGSIVEIDYSVSLVDLFERRVNELPDHIALKQDNESVTYAELNTQANKLSHLLVQQGITSGNRVGIHLQRSISSTIAILATLKLGATYVPLDPAYPEARLNFMADDACINVLFSHSSLSPLQLRNGVTTLHIDAINLELLASDNLNITQTDTPIYVLYTSGSTGTPKGVMGTERGLLNRLHWMWSKHPFNIDDVNCHKTSLNFVDHASELFGSLLNGITTLIIGNHDGQDLLKMSTRISHHKVNRLVLVPSLLDAILSLPEQRQSDFDSITLWTCSGETLTPNTVRNFYHCFPNATLLNIYGSSEVAADVTCFDTRKTINTDRIHKGIPLGQPISNVSTYILDSSLKDVPLGATGELYIGGDCLAKGYTQKPYTDERFTAHVQTGDRLFGTGDLVRWNTYGELEFIGRNDFQVKVRGHRIDLAEIEENLMLFTTIQQCVVTCIHQGENKTLAAYIVPEQSGGISSEVIRQSLQKQLPEYMIPTFIDILDNLPLTPNGKIDRQKLPEPVMTSITSETSYIAPRSMREKQLAEIWKEMFSRDRISIDQSFFALGGNSISAVRLMAIIEENLGLSLSLQNLFQLQTIEGMAAALNDDLQDKIPLRKETLAPLSFAQERLLFIERLEQGTDAYHLPTLLQLNDDIDLGILSKAINHVIERHHVLRTLFVPDENGVDYQTVIDTPNIIEKITVNDDKDIESEVKLHIEKPFNFSIECPLRVTMIEQEAQQYLLFVFHHIAVDGWSTDVFLSEMIASYQAFQKGTKPKLPALQIQYADYAAWQKNTLNDVEIGKQISFWKGQLDGVETLTLATDRARPSSIDYRGKDIAFTLNEALSEKLRSLAISNNTTLYTVLLAGFANVLSTLSSQSDFVIGTPSDNRENPQLHNLIGFFVNTLPLRISIEQDQNAESLIETLHRTLTDAKAHQTLPFEKLVSSLNVPRDTSRHPLFQIMFSLQTFGASHDDHMDNDFGSIISNGPMAETAARYDLSLQMDDSNKEIRGSINYAQALFDHDTIAHFNELLELSFINITDNPDARLIEQHLVTESDERIINKQHGSTQVISELSLPSVFDAIVKKQPLDCAVITDGYTLTYRELDRKANQLANTIIESLSLVENPSKLIPLILTPGIDMLVSIIAVLKAGCAYVPVSPAYPIDRMIYLLEDTQASCIISHSECDNVLASLQEHKTTRPTVLKVDDDSVLSAPSEAPLVAISPNDLAYVIYTSGTTGQPKGVMVEHGNITNYLNAVSSWMADVNNVDFSTNYCFDLTVTTTLIPLLSGKCVCVYDGDILDAVAYSQHLSDKHVDMVKTTPSLAKALLTSNDGISLQLLILGGEALDPATISTLRPIAKVIVDEYGPTETTVGAMIAQVHPSKDQGIGFAYPNTTLFNLSPSGKKLPVGARGELYIGGLSVARGYLNQPSLTEEKFVNAPLGKNGELVRLYRTGDAVSCFGDGSLRYLGRIDEQVKLRGYRIEPAEIAAQIQAIDGIADAAVLPVGQPATHLIAYVVSTPDFDSATQDVKQTLRGSLPEYMIPTAIIALETLPKTANGKLDKQALPAPDLSVNNEFVAPQTPTEKLITPIWAEQLKLQERELSVTANFFELGGHSLLAVQLVNEINKTLCLTLSVREFIERQTLQEVAKRIDEMQLANALDQDLTNEDIFSEEDFF